MRQYYTPQQIEEGPIADFVNKTIIHHPRTVRAAGFAANAISGSVGGPKGFFDKYAAHLAPDHHVKSTPLPKPVHKVAHHVKKVAEPVASKLDAFKQTSHGKVAHALGSQFGKELTKKLVSGAFKSALHV